MFQSIKLQSVKLQHIFLVLGSIFGLLFVFILPPFQAPDELAHFYKAYAISEGQFLCTSEGNLNAGSYLPSNITEFVISTDSTSTNRDFGSLNNGSKYYPSTEKVFTDHYSSCVYNSVPYIPQSLGFFVGNILNLDFMWIFYLGRLFNLVAYLLICAYSIRIIPRLKNLVLLLALMPMSLHQAVSLSADSLTNALSFLFISYILYLKYNEEDYLQRKNYIFIAVLSILISLVKITYFPLSLAVFLIPVAKYKTRKKYLVNNTLIVSLATLSAVVWLLVTRTMNIYFPVDPVVQLNKILQNPLGYCSLLIKNFFNYDGMYLQFVGILGWLNLPIPMIIYILYFVALFIVIFIEASKQKEYTKGRILSGLFSMFIFFSCYILIATSLYLNWPQNNPAIVDGIQGRYFIPAIMLLFYGLYQLVPAVIKYFKLIICIFVIAILFYVSGRMIEHYYFFGPKYELLEPDNNHFIEGGILENTKLSQSFKADKNKLRGISIYISTFQKQITTQYEFVLRDGTNASIIRKIQLDGSEIADNAYYEVLFEPIMNSKGKEFTFSVFPLEGKVNEPITFQLSKPNIYSDGDLFIKGNEYKEDIVFRLLY